MSSPSKPLAVVRDATLADLATINDIHVRSRQVAYRGLLSDRYLDVTMPDASLEDWRRKLPELLAGAGRVLVAHAEGEPVGFVAAIAPDERASVYIHNLHARPDRKGLGVGSALLDAAAQWARARGARAMHLRVLEANAPAIGFYEARGWRCVDRAHDAWAGEPIVALVYAIDLT